MAAEPFLVAGSGRFDTRVIAATGGAALVKIGAEGFFCATLPELRLGVALKVADGAQRAAEVAMAHVLVRLGVAGMAAGDIEDLIEPAIVNRRGETVGAIRTIDHASGSGSRQA